MTATQTANPARLRDLPVYTCEIHDAWLSDHRPPALYTTGVPGEAIPEVPATFHAIAKLMHTYTRNRLIVVACSDRDDHDASFERILVVYDPKKPNMVYKLYPRGAAAKLNTSFTSRTIEWMVRDNELVDKKTCHRMAAWALWSWFKLERPADGE